jgi:hypothetical protein
LAGTLIVNLPLFRKGQLIVVALVSGELAALAAARLATSTIGIKPVMARGRR